MEPELLLLSPSPMPILTDCNLKKFGGNEYHCARYCECFVLIFMLQNALSFTENSELVRLSARDWYIQKKDAFQGGPMPSPSAEYYYLHFDASYSKDSLNKITLPCKGSFLPEQVVPMLKNLYALLHKTPSNPLELQGEFYRLLNLLYVQEAAYSSLTSAVLGYISEHYTEKITGQILSDKFSYSSEYIDKKLKAEIGITPHAYLNNIRIQNAMKLMERTEKSLLDISAECGFSDFSLFYKAFQKKYNLSPSQWKKEKSLFKVY